MVRPADREELLAQQTVALRALTSDGACPDLLHERGHAATRETLTRKRVASLGRHWPDLQQALGDCFQDLSRDYVRSQPRVTSDGRADGRAFAAWLADRRALPDGAVVELVRFDVSYRITAQGLRRRRLPTLHVRRRPRPMVALAVPGLGSRIPRVAILGTTRRP